MCAMGLPVAISVWCYHKKDNWFRDLISRAIVYFTGMEYTHVGVLVAGRHYESTIWKVKGKFLPRTGPRVSLGWPDDPLPDFCMVPDNIDGATIIRLSSVLHNKYKLARPYNVFKLVSLALVWNTRWFWKKIGWVPFDHEIFGEVCSSFVDESFKQAGIDLFPDQPEGYTVPGQFVEIKGWHYASLCEVFPKTAKRG